MNCPGTQDALLANCAALLGGGYWGLYPGECSYARRENLARQSDPKKKMSDSEKLVFFEEDVERLRARQEICVTKAEWDLVTGLLEVALTELRDLKSKINRMWKGGTHV